MTIKNHDHQMKKLDETIYIPFESDPYWKYSQYHCQDEDCDYHGFKYISHSEVVSVNG